MSIQRFLIAGIKVEMDVKGQLLSERSEKYRFDFDGKPDMFLSAPEDKMDIVRKSSPNLSDDQIEYICTSTFFYHKLLKFDGFLIHSSAIQYNGKAYLFTADCGPGKSTHTALWRKYLGEKATIINDDKPAIRLIDGKFYAVGTPWSGKTAQNENVSVPVGSVAILTRSKENFIKPAENTFAVRNLLRQTIIVPTVEELDVLSGFMDKFIRTVPIFHLGCDMSENAVKTSFEAMTHEKYISKGL